jgi:hypothetical protein
MKKMLILMMVVMLTLLTSAVMANQNGEARPGRLFLYQKCDADLIGKEGYDGSGCPEAGNGPWPIFSDKHRWGRLSYSLWGPKFKFSFEGWKLSAKKNYTLIYYPDPWPGEGLICLGAGKSNKAGNLHIKGSSDIGTSLPAKVLNITGKTDVADANFNPISPSGAVGAKIWLVQTEDVDCGDGTSKMLNWNPGAYLFEFNLIVYERDEPDGEEEED